MQYIFDTKRKTTDDILSGLLQKEFENQLFFVEMHVSKKKRGENKTADAIVTVEARCKL